MSFEKKTKFKYNFFYNENVMKTSTFGILGLVFFVFLCCIKLV